MLDNEEEYDRMAAVEEAHWWYRCLHALVLDRLGRLDLPRESEIIDAGCGTGGLLLRLRAAGYRARGFDISPHAVGRCRRRGLPVETGSISELGGLIGPRSASVIICNDVLCYLSPGERAETLTAWRPLLVGGGMLILNVPTGEMFKGIHDLSVGIGERISYCQLRSELRMAGYEPAGRRYWPFLLSPAILLSRIRQRRLLRRGGAEIRSDIDLPPPLLNQAIYALTRLEHHLPIGWFGSSLFVFAHIIDI